MKKLLLGLTLLTSVSSFAGEVCIVEYSSQSTSATCTNEKDSMMKEVDLHFSNSNDSVNINSRMQQSKMKLLKHLVDRRYRYENDNLFIKY